MNNKKCHFCGNIHFSEKTVQYVYQRNKRFMIIDSVPCEECNYCGERYYDGLVIEKIENEFINIYDNHKKIKNQVLVPVESYLELA